MPVVTRAPSQASIGDRRIAEAMRKMMGITCPEPETDDAEAHLENISAIEDVMDAAMERAEKIAEAIKHEEREKQP